MLISHFIDFIDSPTNINYKLARESLLNSDVYNPYSLELDEATKLIETKEYIEAKQIITQAMPNLLLSPRAHLILATIAEALGNEPEADLESSLATICLHGILTTGEGTQENPYLITRVSDEYDLLEYLNKTVSNQSLLTRNHQYLDCLWASDGSQLFFEITALRKTIGTNSFN